MARGAAKPTGVRFPPPLREKKKERGMRTRKVESRLCTRGKTGCPPPLKKAFMQKTKQTAMQSAL